MIIYLLGTIVISFGVVMMLRSGLGMSSWDTLHYSLHKLFGITIGTATIIVALEKGATKVIPCAEVDEAIKFRTNKGVVLVGERKAQIIKGFDFTNSPYDLNSENLTGKIVVITTSTGTKLLSECMGAKHILIASTLNAQFVAEKMSSIGGKWAVIGAGSHGEFRLEDQVGCALVTKHYSKLTGKRPNENSQKIINVYSKDIETHIRMSPSSQKLMLLDRKCDIDFVISKVNHYHRVPQVFQSKTGRMIIT